MGTEGSAIFDGNNVRDTVLPRCIVCLERIRGENARGYPDEAHTVYEDACLAGDDGTDYMLPEVAYTCGPDCEGALSDSSQLRFVFGHPQRKALEILAEWEDLYERDGADSPLPHDLVEDEHPEEMNFFTELFIEAEELHAERFVKNHPECGYNAPQEFMDNMQGYHEEWPGVIEAAKEILG